MDEQIDKWRDHVCSNPIGWYEEISKDFDGFIQQLIIQTLAYERSRLIQLFNFVARDTEGKVMDDDDEAYLGAMEMIEYLISLVEEGVTFEQLVGEE